MKNSISFGKELKVKILRNVPLENIGSWAYDSQFDYEGNKKFSELVSNFSLMEEAEFHYKIEDLNKICDQLIEGEYEEKNFDFQGLSCFYNRRELGKDLYEILIRKFDEKFLKEWCDSIILSCKDDQFVRSAMMEIQVIDFPLDMNQKKVLLELSLELMKDGD